MIKNRSPQFDQYYYSLDWHPSDHVSFIDNVHQRRLAPGSKEPCLYGTVTFEEIRAELKKCDFSNAEIEMFFGNSDKDGDGTITVEESNEDFVSSDSDSSDEE